MERGLVGDDSGNDLVPSSFSATVRTVSLRVVSGHHHMW
jgi:hypothetical protein